MLNPPRKIKFNPYAGLTYEKLVAIIRNVFFPEQLPGKSLASYKFIFLGADVDYKARTEHLTIDEIKEKFSITEKEEKALGALAQAMERKMLAACNKTTETNGGGDVQPGN